MHAAKRMGNDSEAKARSLTERNGPIVHSVNVPIFADTVITEVKIPLMLAGEISPMYIITAT